MNVLLLSKMKTQIKQIKLSSSLTKEWGGWRRSAGESRNRETDVASYYCLLQGQVVPRQKGLHKEHCQRQNNRQKATQKLTLCEQKEKEDKNQISCFLLTLHLLLHFLPFSKTTGRKYLLTVLSPGFLIQICMPIPLLILSHGVHWHYSCQTLKVSLPCPHLHITVSS